MFKTGLICALLAAAAPAGAVPAVAPAPAAPVPNAQQKELQDLDTFMDVYEAVKARYVNEVDSHTLVKGAIEGMLSALDPHSSYAEGSDYEDLQQISDGDYGGLGLVTTVDGGFIRVVSTTEDTPAWKAGIKPKDFITHVDGKLVYGLSLDEATGKLRGDPGSKVKLTIRREGVTKPIQMSVTSGL